jgi:large subunit ribosomal protein L4
MPVSTYTKTGTKAGTAIKLDPKIFSVTEIKHDLLHQAYDAYLANGRINLAKVKTRGLVRGGGRKPWRQKGTGRARVGSRRTPLWRGGGTVFGPTGNENYSHKLNAKTKKVAIRHALSMLNADNAITVIEDINLKEAKTSELNKLLIKIGIKGYTLIVSDNPSIELIKASNNLRNVKVIQAQYLNVARLMDCDNLILTKPALTIIEDWLKVSPKADRN